MDFAFLAILLALSAAVAWGSGDFTGGLVSRRVGPFHTVFIAYSVGLLALILVALARREPFPPASDLAWGALAGLSGMIGLGFLFRGFVTGRMGIVAPVSAVLAAAIPVVFTAFTEGLPRQLQLLGFGLALASIWMLSRPERLGSRPAGLGMALLAGLGFSGFFIAIGQVGEGAVFWPLVAGRLAACAAMTALALFTRRPMIPSPFPLGLLVLAGILDVLGNLFFLLAMQLGRMDVTAVLGSLYPAVTAILAWLLTREHMARLQMLGVAVAVLAIVMITI
ncbi:MAG TPA: EamA family transporter [Anaerolineales bacterium]|nr:EamA family transporter [Anaerolineales bacterium]